MTDVMLQAEIRRKQEELVVLEQKIFAQTSSLMEVKNRFYQSQSRERGLEIKLQGNQDREASLIRSCHLAQEKLTAVREAQLSPMLGSIIVRPRLAEISAEIERIEDSLARATLTEREIFRLRRKLEPLRAMQEVLRERIVSVDRKVDENEHSLRDKDRELTRCRAELDELQRDLMIQREVTRQAQTVKEGFEVEKHNLEAAIIRLREEQGRLEARVVALLSEAQRQLALRAQVVTHRETQSYLVALQIEMKTKRDKLVGLEQSLTIQNSRLLELLDNLYQSRDREHNFEFSLRDKQNIKDFLRQNRELMQAKLDINRRRQEDLRLELSTGSINVRETLRATDEKIAALRREMDARTLTERQRSMLSDKLEPLQIIKSILQESIIGIEQKVAVCEQNIREKHEKLDQINEELDELQRNLTTQGESTRQAQALREGLELERHTFVTEIIKLRQERGRLEARMEQLLAGDIVQTVCSSFRLREVLENMITTYNTYVQQNRIVGNAINFANAVNVAYAALNHGFLKAIVDMFLETTAGAQGIYNVGNTFLILKKLLRPTDGSAPAPTFDAANAFYAAVHAGQSINVPATGIANATRLELLRTAEAFRAAVAAAEGIVDAPTVDGLIVPLITPAPRQIVGHSFRP